MSSDLPRSARIVAAPLLAAAALVFSAGGAGAGIYLDNGLSDVKPEQWAKVAQPQPVQLLFEFQTNGAVNARATKFLKAKVVETVKSSGLFSDVLDQPAPNGALLHVVINDVVNKSEAEGKGFATGLTFGLAGNTVADNYDCTVEYVPGPNADKISKTAHHRLYSQVGMTAPTPPNATKAASLQEAIFTMTRQCVSNPLNAVAGEPAFGGVVASAAPAAAPAAPTTTAAAPTAAAPAGEPTAPAAPDAPKAPAAADAPKTPQEMRP